MIFEIELSNIHDTNLSNAVKIDLPATWAELNDALQKARVPDDRALYKVNVWDSNPECLLQIMPNNINLYELNHLAQRLEKMQDSQIDAFEGLTMMDVVRTGYAPIPIERLINMTHSLVDCHFIYEAFDDRTLGKFYAENDFITELQSLPENVFSWLDYEKIGKYMREAEKGVFIPCGYVVQTGEMSKEYSFDTANLEPKPDYVFLLEIATAPKNDDPNDTSSAILKLPATIDDITKALAEVRSCSLQECVFYRFDSLVPELSTVFGNMDDFKELDDLAQEIKAIDAKGDLPKFKALLEAKECYSLVPLTELARDLDSYTFHPETLAPSAYAKSMLETLDIPMKESLLNMATLDAYGKELMEHDNMHSTSYGFISRKDGEPILLQEQEGPVMKM